MRLAKFLASAGVASRRAAEEIVANGRVAVGAHTVTDPARDVSDTDDVRVDGALVRLPVQRAVYLVNKPAGVVSTASDPQRRATIVSLVPSEARLYPVGRLDLDVTGLILLTNDGDLAYRLTHPSFEVPRTYRAQVRNSPISDRAVRALRAGIRLDDGMTAPARVRRLGGRDGGALELTIHEGRKRQVKRMCEAVGHPVIRLERTAFGPLALGDLAPGGHRRLTAEEVADLSRPGCQHSDAELNRAGRSAHRGSAPSSAGRRRPPSASRSPGDRRGAAGS